MHNICILRGDELDESDDSTDADDDGGDDLPAGFGLGRNVRQALSIPSRVKNLVRGFSIQLLFHSRQSFFSVISRATKSSVFRACILRIFINDFVHITLQSPKLQIRLLMIVSFRLRLYFLRNILL